MNSAGEGGVTRILMLLENNPYPQDVRVRSEAESLARAGYTVTVAAPRQAGQTWRERIGGVKVRRYRMPQLPSTPIGFVVEYAVANARLHFIALWELAKGVEAIHLHNPPDTLFGVAFLARLLRRKVVFDHHDLAPELFEAKLGPSPVVRLLRAFERLTFRSANMVLAANESHREVALGRGGMPPERVVVVRNGPPDAALARATHGREGSLEDPRLLFLGSMETQDGVDDLVPLLRLLVERHGLRGANLTLVGDGSRRSAMLEQAAAAKLSDRVRSTGLVAHAEVPRHLAEADICLDPAPCTELNHRSTMIKIAEYMAAGRPIVAFPLTETRRTAGTAVAYVRCGSLDSLAETVAELARDPDRRLELAEQGRERARSLTWSASETELIGAYKRLLAS